MLKQIKRVLLPILCFSVFYSVFPAAAKAETVGWTTISTNMNDSVITSSDANSYKPSPVFVSDGSNLYTAWVQKNGANSYIRVKKLTGTSWSYIDNGGLNIKSSMNAYNPNLIMYQDNLYIAWEEQYFTGQDYHNIYVKKYNGGTSWSRVDGSTDAGLSYDGNQDSENVFLQVHNDKLYAAWSEHGNFSQKTQIHVKEYNGDNSWSFIDGAEAGVSEHGLNYNNNMNGSSPCLISYNNNLYAAWTENNLNDKLQIRIKCFNGSSWNFIDGGSDIGINNNPGDLADKPELFVLNNTLYAAWKESNFNNLIIKKYNGDSSWTLKENTLGSLFNGVETYVYQDKLYMVYIKGTNTCVLRFDGTSFTDMNNNTKLNTGATGLYGKPAITLYNKTLYVTWPEADTATNLSTSNYSIVTQSLVLPHTHVTASGLTENSLDNASINLKLEGTNFTNSTLNPASFRLNNAPNGLSIESINYKDSNEYTINLAFNGTDFDSDINNFNISIAGNEVLSGEDVTDTDILPITAVNDAESITLADDGNIESGSENGEYITVTINGGTFAGSDQISSSNFSVANLPDGVTVGSLERVDNKTVHIILSGNASTVTDTDITNVSVTCLAGGYSDSTGGSSLAANTGVTIKKKQAIKYTTFVNATTGGSIDCNGISISTPYDKEFEAGTAVTLTAKPDTGCSFLYWMDADSFAIITSEETYEFTAGSGANIKAVFKEDTTCTVIFKDPTGRVLSIQTLAAGDDATAPESPYIIGYEFLGWNKSYSDVTSDLVITAQFKRTSTTYSLIVNGSNSDAAVNGSYQYDKPVSVSAAAAPSGKVFSYWLMNGTIISRKPDFSFYTIMDTMNLTAVYEDMASTGPFIGLFPNIIIDKEHEAMLFTAVYDPLPSGFNLIESGILLLKESSVWTGELTVDTVNAIHTKVYKPAKNQINIRKYNISTGDTWYARAYMIYTDASGHICVIYSSNTENGTMS